MKKIIKRGVIANPDNYKNWIIEIVDDTESTGGFYLLRYTVDQKEGFDDWYLKEEQIYKQLEFDKLIVNWDTV